MVQTINNNVINDKMTPEQFVYWLQGWLEISDPKTIGEKETKMIKQHLDYVFSKGHVTSSIITTGSPGITIQGQAGGFTVPQSPYTAVC